MTCAWTSAGPLRRAAVRGRARAWRVGLRAKSVPSHFRDVEAGERRARASRWTPPARLDFDRHRDRVAVVLDQEEDRQLQVAGRVQRFPELAFARRALAERDVDDLVRLQARVAIGSPGIRAVISAGLGRADRLQELRAGGARLARRCSAPCGPSATASGGRRELGSSFAPTAASSISSGVTPSWRQSARSR